MAFVVDGYIIHHLHTQKMAKPKKIRQSWEKNKIMRIYKQSHTSYYGVQKKKIAKPNSFFCTPGGFKGSSVETIYYELGDLILQPYTIFAMVEHSFLKSFFNCKVSFFQKQQGCRVDVFIILVVAVQCAQYMDFLLIHTRFSIYHPSISKPSIPQYGILGTWQEPRCLDKI